jgi:hypothetical protein
MLDEGSRTSRSRTANAVTIAADGGTVSQATLDLPSTRRTSRPSVSPRTPRKWTTLPSKIADLVGEGSLRSKRFDSPRTCTAGPRRQPTKHRLRLTSQQLADGNQLMAGLLQSVEDWR